MAGCGKYAVLSYLQLGRNGILIFDDYEWGRKDDALLRPRISIDAFLRNYQRYYRLLEKSCQVILEKCPIKSRAIVSILG